MEIWKEITGFEGVYEISNEGRLRSKDRLIKHWRGTLRKYKGSLKKTRMNRMGYMHCNLKHNGERFDFRVHRLVADAFLENKENKPCVNHLNGIKTDNRVENLEWCNYEENTIHATKTRLIKTKLTDKEAIEISNSNLTIRELGQKFNVNATIIWRIKNKVAYKHLFIED